MKRINVIQSTNQAVTRSIVSWTCQQNMGNIIQRNSCQFTLQTAGPGTSRTNCPILETMPSLLSVHSVMTETRKHSCNGINSVIKESGFPRTGLHKLQRSICYFTMKWIPLLEQLNDSHTD